MFCSILGLNNLRIEKKKQTEIGKVKMWDAKFKKKKSWTNYSNVNLMVKDCNFGFK